MDWQKQMNEAMEYIEDNLVGQMEYETLAQYMNVSEGEFRRIFSFLTQMSLSEYIRNRRLTMAVKDLQKGEKIIQVALRYGYESQAAFSRAFRNLHGIAPSLAREKGLRLNFCPRLTFKMVMMEGLAMEKDENQRTNIIGAGDTGYAVAVEMNRDNIHATNETFWSEKGNEVVGTMALPKYGAFTSEDACQLLGDLRDKKVLEIGCGTGHSLQYVGERGAAELWGLDISEDQIHKAKNHLAQRGMEANLICAPMETDCGIPQNYFDIVYSVYGIGWTTDLEGTFRRIASYLKNGGTFIFSWSHPIHKCVAVEGDVLNFKKNYFDESWYSVAVDGGVLSLSDRKMSTYVNALAKAGFFIEEMVEQSEEKLLNKKDSQFAQKARMLPVTVVIKARRL